MYFSVMIATPLDTDEYPALQTARQLVEAGRYSVYSIHQQDPRLLSSGKIQEESPMFRNEGLNQDI